MIDPAKVRALIEQAGIKFTADFWDRSVLPPMYVTIDQLTRFANLLAADLASDAKDSARLDWLMARECSAFNASGTWQEFGDRNEIDAAMLQAPADE